MTTLRAQDAPRFRVMAGQRWERGRLALIVVNGPVGHGGKWWTASAVGSGAVVEIDGRALVDRYTLDESDPATMGTVECLVRKAWAGHAVHITEYQRPDHYHVEIDRAGPDGFPVGAWAGHAPTRHEAWAAALHAAPEGA